MSVIDGRKVGYRGRDDYEGLVMGDSYIPGTVRVAWTKPRVHTGAHKVSDLVVKDSAEDNLPDYLKETP